MRLIDYIQISSKHLYKRKLRTALTVSGICVGIVFFTMMVSLIYGGKQKMDEVLDYSKVLNNIYISPHIETTEREEGQKELLREVTEGIQSRHQGISKENLDKIRAVPHVAAAESFTEINVKSIRKQGSSDFYMARVSGTPVNEYFQNEILVGRDFDQTDKEAIILTPIYLESMGIEGPHDIIGKNVVLEIERTHSQPTEEDEIYLEKERRKIERTYKTEAEMRQAMDKLHQEFQAEIEKRPRETKNYTAEVIGIAMADMGGDRSLALIPRPWAKEMLQWSFYDMEMREQDMHHMLLVKADDPENVEGIVADIQAMGYGARSIKRAYKQIEGPIYGISLGLGSLALIALSIACIGVVNTMIMAIYERTREIGIMKATGATSRNIKGLFTIEAGVMGTIAGGIGVAAGYGLARLIQYIVQQAIFGDGKVVNSPLFEDGIVDIIELPIWMIILVIAFGCLIGMLAGYFPARRAAKMDPAQALRYE